MKISELPAADALAGTEGVPVVQAGETRLATVADLGGGGGGGLWVPTDPPAVADFAWVNQGGASAVDTDYGIFVKSPSTGGPNNRILDRALAGAQWSVATAIVPLLHASGYATAGLIVRNATDGKVQLFGVVRNGGGQGEPSLTVANWNSPTVWASESFAASGMAGVPTPFGLRIRQDATTRFFEFSLDGENWLLHASQAAGTHVVPDRCGITLNPDSSTAGRESGVAVLDFVVA